MDIYSSDWSSFFFDVSYGSKWLLKDSMERSINGWHQLTHGQPFAGSGNLLLARIESVASWALVVLSGTILGLHSLILTPFFIIPTTVLNLASRLPGISYFESVKNFTTCSSTIIYRTARVHLLAIPVLFLFTTAAVVNTVIPCWMKPDGFFMNGIHALVSPLGNLQSVKATISKKQNCVGKIGSHFSPLEVGEEYLRALSMLNTLKEIQVISYTHHYSYTQNY